VATQLDRILSADYHGDLQQRSMEDVRSMRTECQAVETGLSYLRRMVQGRLDIVGVELQRRRDGGEPGDLATLVSRLPEILSEHSRSPGVGRLPQTMAPGEIDPGLEQQLNDIVGLHDVESLPSLQDDELLALHDALETFEHEVSARRRDVFDRIDTLQAEITRRYRTGEASVETLLQ
jgi:hypothetical protein